MELPHSLQAFKCLWHTVFAMFLDCAVLHAQRQVCSCVHTYVQAYKHMKIRVASGMCAYICTCMYICIYIYVCASCIRMYDIHVSTQIATPCTGAPSSHSGRVLWGRLEARVQETPQTPTPPIGPRGPQ